MASLAASSDAPHGRKRPAVADHEGERASKRRRLGQASVLCMRELFRAVVNDGDISEDNRIVLQNVGVLLSQVDGKTWVNFSDTQGLQELAPQQLRHLRPFLDKVAQELKARETEVLSDSHSGEQLDCLELIDVPWADGITARELLACCSPDEEVNLSSRYVWWLEKVIRVLPSKYMLKSRVRQLVNYYHIQTFIPTEIKAEARAAPVARAEAACFGWWWVKVLLICSRCCLGVGRSCLRRSRGAAAAMSSSVAAVVVSAAAAVVALLSRLSAVLPLRNEPVWPVLRLFLAVLLQGQVKKLLELIVLIARLRVILCLASCNDVFGYVFAPFVFIAQKVLGWNEGSWLLGCTCDSSRQLSLLSWAPVRASEGLIWVLTLVRFLPSIPGLQVMATIIEPSVHMLQLLQPMVSFLLDLLFSIGFAEGLAMVVQSVDSHAQHKLVWLSMNVARTLRERSLVPSLGSVEMGSSNSGFQEAAAGTASGLGSEDVAMHASAESAPIAVPEWSEDGAWTLFDAQ
ncbi:unnamed protein product [Polarella glacialis]|uniref:Uncharacterized protein n=1 Tax=Polarella glacialis TaxID=89957 RepID=A0A813HPL8_POLGL|nr:unnamed protein product [Polarella glacialis]CAE8656787.1 unnamed protein product [Polarella glacialis]